MDADDISLPDRIEKQICFLNEHPEIDVVGGAINEIDEEGCESGKTIVYPATPTECKKFLRKRNPLAHPAVLFRKSFFDKIGHCYRPEYRKNQDTMLWYDGLMHGVNIANLPNVVLKFRMTEALFKKRRNGWVFAKNNWRTDCKSTKLALRPYRRLIRLCHVLSAHRPCLGKKNRV